MKLPPPRLPAAASRPLRAAGPLRPAARAPRLPAAALALLVLAAACDNGRLAGLPPGDIAAPAPGHRQGGPRTLYVATGGDDLGLGTRDDPWRTVERGISMLLPGDTLILRHGTYYETKIPIRVAGTLRDPITIRCESGEHVVVDGSLAAYREPRKEDWDVVDAARSIYRSTATYPSAGLVHGHLAPEDGAYRLVAYERLLDLLADGEDYSETQPYYSGPGVFWNPDDHRIYVRLQRSRYQIRLGHNVPALPDPRRTPLFLFPRGSLLDPSPLAAHLVFEGLDLRNAEHILDLPTGCHDVTVRDCRLRAGRYEIVVRDQVHDLEFTGLAVNGRFPPWVPRSDVKRPEGAAPARQLQGAAVILNGAVDAVRVHGCDFRELFDGLDTTGRPTNLQIHGNLFTQILDDAIELATPGYGVEIAYNTIRRTSAAISWNGTVHLGASSPPPGHVGTKFIHHNVIDTSSPQLFGRDDPLGLLPARWRGPQNDGMATGRPFGSHDMMFLAGADPWKIYHNTLVCAEDVDNQGSGATWRWIHDPAHPHEVLNNVFVQVADRPILVDAHVDDGSQVFDGNLYFRPLANPLQPLLQGFRLGGTPAPFRSLTGFLTSAHWTATRTAYPPGWEAGGVEADPLLDGRYRPAATGPAASGAVNLVARGWPGASDQPFRGALAPR